MESEMNTLDLIATLKPTLDTLALQGEMAAALKIIDGLREMSDAYPHFGTLLKLRDEIGHLAYPNGEIGFIRYRDQGYRAALINQVKYGYGAGWGSDVLNIGS